MLVCAECNRESDDATGWRAMRCEDTDNEKARPELAFFCPECAEREFGDE